MPRINYWAVVVAAVAAFLVADLHPALCYQRLGRLARALPASPVILPFRMAFSGAVATEGSPI
jgi:hypothetical protein